MCFSRILRMGYLLSFPQYVAICLVDRFSFTENNSKPESSRSHPAVASPPAAVVQAGQEKCRTREPRAEGEKDKPSRPKRDKECRTEKEEKCSRAEREAERERERGWSREVERGKRMEKEKEHKRKSINRRNQAAGVIQTAWRRY